MNLTVVLINGLLLLLIGLINSVIIKECTISRLACNKDTDYYTLYLLLPIAHSSQSVSLFPNNHSLKLFLESESKDLMVQTLNLKLKYLHLLDLPYLWDEIKNGRRQTISISIWIYVAVNIPLILTSLPLTFWVE